MNKTRTHYITKVGVLAAIAFILQFAGTMMGIKVGGFLDVEFSDYPAVIGALAMGPAAGIFIEFIKNLLHCTMTTTGYVGELANLIVTGCFVFTVGFFYSKHKTKKGAMAALLLGTIFMTLAAMLANYFILLPLYMTGADFSTKFSLVLSVITPFNLCKGLVISIITLFSYKALSPILHK